MDCDDAVDTNYIQVLPDTCVELFVNYTSTPVAIIGHELHKRSIVTARMSRSMEVQMRKGAGCLAICFYPGMAYPFFRLPMQVLSDTTVTLSNLWSGTVMEMEDKLANASDNNVRVVIAQKYLLQQLALGEQDLQLTYWLRLMQRSGGSISATDIANDTGLSRRHLSRKFQQYMGLSPKTYLGVCRFMRSLHSLKKYPALSLTQVAYESGYYDQAHFNRDYKMYTGHTPGEVLRAQYIVY